MSEYIITKDDGSEELIHYGIKGQKWGDRNYQNPDGTLTPEGIRRYRELKNKYKLADVQSLYKKSGNIENGKITNAGYEQIKSNAAKNRGLSIGKTAGFGSAGVASIGTGVLTNMTARAMEEAGRDRSSALAYTKSLIDVARAATFISIAAVNADHIKKSTNIIKQNKNDTISEVNEYLKLEAIKNKK